MSNIMVDLETLGNDYDGIILSIGACKFDLHTGDIGETFYRNVDINSQPGRTITGDTVYWWLDQSDEARRALFINSNPPIPLEKMLIDFSVFVGEHPVMWACGTNFDIGKLETAYGYGKAPWAFRNIRDLRTLRDIYADVISPVWDTFETGTEHNALDDAIRQAKEASSLYGKIREAVKNG